MNIHITETNWTMDWSGSGIVTISTINDDTTPWSHQRWSYIIKCCEYATGSCLLSQTVCLTRPVVTCREQDTAVTALRKDPTSNVWNVVFVVTVAEGLHGGSKDVRPWYFCSLICLCLTLFQLILWLVFITFSIMPGHTNLAINSCPALLIWWKIAYLY